MTQIGFNFEKHHFYGEVPEALDKPLTLTLQVTRRCNLHCIYCSEEKQLPEPNKRELEDIMSKIRNVRRIIVSGGEPLLRLDIINILKELRSQRNILALATNCTRVDKESANKLVGLIDYADVTIDGPRNIHNIIRGNYDSVLEGVFNLREKGIEYSFVTVLVPQNFEYLEDICQIVDTLGGRKHKILTPIPKGRGKEIYKETKDRYSLDEIFSRLRSAKEKKGWRQRITITDWTKIGEGHALLIHPDGNVVASPIFCNDKEVEYVGNLHRESLEDIWKRYPHKQEHFKKYLEKSLYVL